MAHLKGLTNDQVQIGLDVVLLAQLETEAVGLLFVRLGVGMSPWCCSMREHEVVGLAVSRVQLPWTPPTYLERVPEDGVAAGLQRLDSSAIVDGRDPICGILASVDLLDLIERHTP